MVQQATETTLSFAAPPVVEVVAGVALDAPEPQSGPLMAAFWADRLRQEFPNLEEQPPYFPVTERFTSATAPFEFQWRTGPAPVRLWASRPDGNEVVQLQPGWFACNWRKRQIDDEYDRWPKRRSQFEKWYSALSNFFVEVGASEPRIAQCEVTYVNHLRSGGIWSKHSDFGKIFDVSSSAQPPGNLSLEQASVQANFLIADEGGAPVGRLHANVAPFLDTDGTTAIYLLELTARGAPLREGVAGAVEFLNIGRTAINSMFVTLTTSAAQREWRRTG